MIKNLIPCTLLIVSWSFIATAQNSTAPSPKLVETLKLIQDKLKAQGELVSDESTVFTNISLASRSHYKIASIDIDPATCNVKVIENDSISDNKNSDRRMKGINKDTLDTYEIHYNLKDIAKVSYQSQQDMDHKTLAASADFVSETITPNLYVIMLESDTKSINYHIKVIYGGKNVRDNDDSLAFHSIHVADQATADLLANAFTQAKLLCSSPNTQSAPDLPVATATQAAAPTVTPKVATTAVPGTTQVAPPPRPAVAQAATAPNTTAGTTASGPTLDATMEFLQRKMLELTPLSYEVFGQDSDTGAASNFKVTTAHFTSVHADPATCVLDSVESSTDESGRTNQSAYSLSLREAQDVVVEPLEQFSSQYIAMLGRPNIVYSSTNPGVTAVVIRKSPKAFTRILVTDPGLADRLAKAAVHAIELCGGGNKDPF